MNRTHFSQQIPIELLRAIVEVVEHDSVTNAARALGLTQPAVSGQIKRLEQIVGAELFQKSGSGLRLTPRGEVVAGYARRILALNDQILAGAGASTAPRLLRVGLATVYADAMLGDLAQACASGNSEMPIQFYCDMSNQLARNLHNGYLDFAIMMGEPLDGIVAASRWSEKLAWIGGYDFTFDPAGPIPLITWADGVADDIAIQSLRDVDRPYTITFKASDWSARIAAVHAGLGLLVLPARLMGTGLKIAEGFGLPVLPGLPGGIYLREGFAGQEFRPLLRRLEAVVASSDKQSIAV